MSNAGVLVIRRVPKLKWAFLRLAVFVDRQLVGQLRNRGEVRITLPEGKHVVQTSFQGVHSFPVYVELAAGTEVLLETAAPEFQWAQALMPPGSIPPPRPQLSTTEELKRAEPRDSPQRRRPPSFREPTASGPREGAAERPSASRRRAVPRELLPSGEAARPTSEASLRGSEASAPSERRGR